MNKKWPVCMAALVLAAAAPQASAVDGAAVELGRGDGADMGRVAVQWNWTQRWFEGAAWHVSGYWDLALGQWRRAVQPGQNNEITDIGLTPVFRLQRHTLSGLFVEAAVGIHLLSRTSLGDKRFSTRFQFGDHLGFGYRFGGGAWELGYRLQHLSNAGIKRPNDGINFHQVRVQVHFE
jgi:lipid A 3-O-deacylase